MSRDILMCALKTLQRVQKECDLEPDGLGYMVTETVCSLIDAIQDSWRGIAMYPDGRMRTEDAARYLGLAPKTLAIMRCSGKGPRFVKKGRIFYFKEDIDAWLNTHRMNKNKGEAND